MPGARTKRHKRAGALHEQIRGDREKFDEELEGVLSSWFGVDPDEDVVKNNKGDTLKKARPGSVLDFSSYLSNEVNIMLDFMNFFNTLGFS